MTVCSFLTLLMTDCLYYLQVMTHASVRPVETMEFVVTSQTSGSSASVLLDTILVSYRFNCVTKFVVTRKKTRNVNVQISNIYQMTFTVDQRLILCAK